MSYSVYRLIIDICFAAYLAWAAYTDRQTMTIKNTTVLCMGALALMHLSFLFGRQADMYPYLYSLLMIIPLYVSWQKNAIGGGDIKMMAAMCLYFGLFNMAFALVFSAAYVLGVILYRKRHRVKRKTYRKMILGPPLAFGGIVCLVVQHIAWLW